MEFIILWHKIIEFTTKSAQGVKKSKNWMCNLTIVDPIDNKSDDRSLISKVG